VMAIAQKTFRSSAIQWVADESYLFRQNTNEVAIYSRANLREPYHRLRHVGYSQFSVGMVSASLIHVAVFNAEAGGKPGIVNVYTFKPLPTPTIDGPIASRTIFGASEARMSWNKQVSGCIISHDFYTIIYHINI
jgi:uncharacterized protein with WD repeat